MQTYDIFLDSLPKVDLHGFDKESARVMTNDFVKEAFILNYSKIVIIHGIGTGIVKKSVHTALSKNKFVESYNISPFNIGCTIVTIKHERKYIL